jgi:hypothetical protein
MKTNFLKTTIVLFPKHKQALIKEANKMDIPNYSAVIRKLINDNLINKGK